MDVKAFPALIVGVVVALVLAGAVLPVFAETTSAETTFKNEGFIYMDPIGENSDITLVWAYTDPTQITINDTVKSLPSDSVFPFTVAFSNDWMARLTPTNNGGIALNIVDTTSSNTVISASVGTLTNMTIQLINDTATFTVGSTVITKDIVGGLCISEDWDNAEYVLKKSTETAIIKNDSMIYGVGRTDRAVGSADMAIKFSGSVDGGVDVLYSPNTFTVSNVALNYTELNSYEDAYNLVGFSATFSTNGQSGNVVYNQVFVPHFVTAEKSVHPDGPLTVILNVLPLLAIAGLVTGAVVWFINRKG